MKTTAKQLLAVLPALVMTVSFMTFMAVSTSAATTPVPVGTNGDIQGDSRISILDVTCIQKYLAEFRDGTASAGEFAMTLI